MQRQLQSPSFRNRRTTELKTNKAPNIVSTSNISYFSIVGLTISLILINGIAAQAQLTKLPKDGPARQSANSSDAVKQLKEAPANFDAPLYTRNVESTKFSQIDSTNGATTTAVINTSDTPEAAFRWYQSTLSSSGWEVEQPKSSATDPNTFMLKAQKARQRLFLSCFRPAKFNATIVSVSTIAQ